MARITQAATAHKFEIYKDKSGGCRVGFKYNSEVIFSTEGYASKSGAKDAVESIQKNAPGAAVEQADWTLPAGVRPFCSDDVGV